MNGTFSRPLQKKRTDFSLQGIFTPKGLSEVGDVYRDRFGGAPFPITRNPKPVEKWFCSYNNCSFWRDTDGKSHGSCSGTCLIG